MSGHGPEPAAAGASSPGSGRATWTGAALVKSLGGDQQLARELVAMFLAEYPAMLDAVRTSVVRGDAEALKRAAHALRGCVANFIADGPVSTAFALERAGEERRLEDAAGLLARLEHEVEQLTTAMRAQGTRPCES